MYLHILSTFSDYGSNVCINYFLFAFLLINITSLCSKVQQPNNVLCLVAASLFTIFISTCTVINKVDCE